MILQPVRAHEYVGGCRYTGYEDKRIRLHLACGHEQSSRKASQGVPTRARCTECERAADASVTSQDRAGGA